MPKAEIKAPQTPKFQPAISLTVEYEAGVQTKEFRVLFFPKNKDADLGDEKHQRLCNDMAEGVISDANSQGFWSDKKLFKHFCETNEIDHEEFDYFFLTTRNRFNNSSVFRIMPGKIISVFACIVDFCPNTGSMKTV